MKTAITITIRLKSTRLRKKVLKEICGKPMIELLIERLKRSKLADEIIMCTSTNSEDNDLIPIAEKTHIRYFRGSEDDVLDRLYNAALKFNVDFIVSCTGDNPLTDPVYIDRIIEKFKETNADYIIALDLPWGVFSYGVKVSAIKKVLGLKKEKDTEVWGQYFTKSNFFKIEKVDVDKSVKFPELRLTVDTPEDFELMKKLYEELYPKNNNFNLKDVIDLLKKKPELKKINEKIKQKIPKSINRDNLIDKSKSTLFKLEMFKEMFDRLSNEKKLSEIINKDPKILILNLPAGFKGEKEVHENEDDLYFVLEGKAELITGKDKLEIKQGDIIHIPRKQVHKLAFTEKGIKYLVIKLKNGNQNSK